MRVFDETLVEMDSTEYGFYKETKMPVFAFASQAKGFLYKYAIGGVSAQYLGSIKIA